MLQALTALGLGALLWVLDADAGHVDAGHDAGNVRPDGLNPGIDAGQPNPEGRGRGS
jgi:hypothetical protein